MLYSKELEVRYCVDVLVLGGGPAGVAAAVTSAKCGATTLIIEKTGTFGGMSTIGMVPEIMNFDDGENFLAGGFGRTVHDALYPECKYEREWMMVNPEKLKRVYDDEITNADVKFLFYTHAIDAIVENKKVTHAIVSSPSGNFAISAKFFIDCTGSASFADMAGCETYHGDDKGHTMPATLCSLWGNADFERADLGMQMVHLEKAIKEGILSNDDKLLPGMKPTFPECQVAGGNIGHAFEVDDTDVESLSSAMIESRRILFEYESYYRKYVEGFEKVKLLRSADFLGIRESRRAVCDFTLTFEYFSGKRAFYDEIGRYSYPIDIHPMKEGNEALSEFHQNLNNTHDKGESYSIPYRSLVLRDSDNLLTAGRTVGADRAMTASVRVIPGAYITGQAAGAAAAIAIKDACSSHDVDHKMLQRILKDLGAYLRVDDPEYEIIK